jgi:hypothetical protein
MDKVKCCFAILLAMLPLGCVQRQMTVLTDPPGAVVYLNDREMGRTPFTKTFLWYGNYDVVIRKDGYQALKTTAEITAPFWQFVPFDLVTDFLPLTDNETISFKLTPQGPVDLKAMVQHGLAMQQELQGSEHTVRHSVLDVRPGTKPTTAPVMQEPD